MTWSIFMFFKPKYNFKRKRYKKINGKNTIEMKIRSTDHLFDGRDPAPFREKDLDEDAVEYITSSLRELPDDQPTQLKLYFSEPRSVRDNVTALKEAIRHHFEYEVEMKRRERRHILRVALRAMFIGLSFLFVCIYLSTFINAEASIFHRYVSEGLNILGWYSMWKPIYFGLYEWWPTRDDEILLKRASELDIDIVFRNELIEVPKKGEATELIRKMNQLAMAK